MKLAATLILLVLNPMLCSIAQAQTFPGDNLGEIADGLANSPESYGPPRDITFEVSGLSGTISSLQVDFSADHSWVGDLRVTLIAPNGKSHRLFARTGSTTAGGAGSSLNLVSTEVYRFSDAFTTNWWTAAASGAGDIPGTEARTVESGGAGTTNPPAVTSLDEAFRSTPPNGTWRLRFEDGFSGDTGQVTAANLVILSTAGVTREVNTTADSGPGSLRQALLDAIFSSGDLITFDEALFAQRPQTIALESELPIVETDLAIQGPGSHLLTVKRIEGGPRFRVITAEHQGALTISGMTISNGYPFLSEFGGGGIRTSAALTLSDVILRSNRSPVAGGGLMLTNSGTIIDSAIIGNIAGNQGGGVSFQETPDGARLLIENSTISSNRASAAEGAPETHGIGAGLANISGMGSQFVELLNTTVVDNVAADAPNASGGISTLTVSDTGPSATTTLRNSIVARNQGGNLRTTVFDGNGTATMRSLGFNLSDDFNDLAILDSDITAVPHLSPLARHGGGPPGHLPLAGSPALDAGNSSGRALDQRGAPRVFDISAIDNAQAGGDGSDIGALENQAIVVSSPADSGAGTLREAIETANANGPGLDDITFDPVPFATARTIDLQSALPTLQGRLSITGNGADLTTVRRNSASLFRIFDVAGGAHVSLTSLAIRDGDVGSEGVGGGVNNFGDLDITASLIDGNAANGAGGVNSSRVLRVVNSTISNNIANFSGGGLYNLNGYAEIEGSTISGNTALQLNGAGVITVKFDAGLAQTTITNSTIANNLNESGFPAAGLLVVAQGAKTQALATTRNSLYANNLPDNMGITVALGGLSATISDQGFNLSTDDSSEFLSPGANNANAALGPLTLNGGPVPTHALLPSSDALDAGSGEGAWFIFDQRGRGFARTTEQDVENAPGGDGTDVGAQEQQLFVDELFSDRFEN